MPWFMYLHDHPESGPLLLMLALIGLLAWMLILQALNGNRQSRRHRQHLGHQRRG